MILAIDPSLTNTAIIQGDAANYDLAVFGSKNQGDHVGGRVARYDALVARIMDWVGSDKIDAIYIEAYSYGSNDARAKFSAEYGGILRWHLAELTGRVYEVAPTTLKKFCTGKGSGPKDMIAAHLTKRYGVLLASNDEFDAYGIYRLGLVAEGLAEPLFNAQREAAEKVLGRPIKTKTPQELF